MGVGDGGDGGTRPPQLTKLKGGVLPPRKLTDFFFNSFQMKLNIIYFPVKYEAIFNPVRQRQIDLEIWTYGSVPTGGSRGENRSCPQQPRRGANMYFAPPPKKKKKKTSTIYRINCLCSGQNTAIHRRRKRGGRGDASPPVPKSEGDVPPNKTDLFSAFINRNAFNLFLDH